MPFETRFQNLIARSLLIFIIGAYCLGARAPMQQPDLTEEIRAALDQISADSLRGHLSFIASDILEGRNTPSRGLDIAAHYIAAQFRRAGLEPVGDDGYFQTADWLLAERDAESFDLKFHSKQETFSIDKKQASLTADEAMQLSRAAIFKLDFKDRAALASLKPEQIAGKVILTEMPDFRREDRSRWGELFQAQNDFLNRVRSLKPALVVSIDRVSLTGNGPGSGKLIDPENRNARAASSVAPLITVHDPRAVKLYDEMKQGLSADAVSLRLASPVERPVKLRNVVGLLRGSDPALKDTYVLITAHYDHIGAREGGEGDQIFNGANDDGSGTVSVIEIASALAKLKQRPKRSIVFMTVFGEEKGLLGSRYYGRHPLFPIEKTVANINLEQVGRTDSSEGPQLSNATFTGFDYSDLPEAFKAAGKITGVSVYKHEHNSDSFFGRSDNQALADQGVPAHTLCVAFVYPDYHGAGDHWEKIDYANMEKIDRMAALGIIMIANNPAAPKWNEANPKAERYVRAWKARHAGSASDAHR